MHSLHYYITYYALFYKGNQHHAIVRISNYLQNAQKKIPKHKPKDQLDYVTKNANM